MKKISTTGPGLVIGIPTLRRPVSMEWAMAWKQLSPPINFNTNFSIVQGKPVDIARQEIAEFALSVNAKYLFFLGDDVVVPPHTLRQLIFRMENNISIGTVGGVYCSKSNPPSPLVFRGNGQGTYWDWKVGEFFEVTGLGMDCTLIRTEVFKEIPKPWFKTVDDDNFLDGVNKAELWTEDLYFFEKLRNTNWKVYCDGSVICQHYDVYNDRYYNLPANSLPTRRLLVDKPKKAIDIGCGPLNRSEEFPEFELVRVDIREDVNPDYCCSVDNLPFENGEFDLVFSAHVLEHFPRNKWRDVLKEWVRLIKKPEGEIILVLPNIEWAIENFKDVTKLNDVYNVLYGAQSYNEDFHYNGLTPNMVESELKLYGLNILESKLVSYNMVIHATYKTLNNV
jgi:SAM-dependent methyltransferase